MTSFLTVKRDICRKYLESFIKFWESMPFFSQNVLWFYICSISYLEIPNAYALSFPLKLLRVSGFKKLSVLNMCDW